MRKKHSVVAAGLCLSLVLGLGVGCSEDASDQISAFVPGPAFTPAPSDTVSGDAVGTDPSTSDQPDGRVPPPVGAPTIPPTIPDPAAPPIDLDDPETVIPGAPVGSLACTPVTNGVILTVSASFPAPITSVSDIAVEDLDESIVLTISSENIPALDVEGEDSVGATFTVPFDQDTISRINNEDTLVVSLSFTDGNGNVLSLEALPCVAIIDPSALPPPEGIFVDTLSFSADTFSLTQTSSTGIVGFGAVDSDSVNFVGNDFDGPGSSAFPDNGISFIPCGPAGFFEGGVPPVLLVNDESGAIVNINQGTLNPSTTRGVDDVNTVVLSGQRLFLTTDNQGRLSGNFAPSNFTETYRINFFQSQLIEFTIGTCEIDFDPETGIFTETLVFTQSTSLVADVLSSAIRELTLNGTEGGPEEPNEGTLIGAEVQSDVPLDVALIETEDPRFSGVFNLLDVSGNTLRTDIKLSFDQVAGQPTQAAINDLPLDEGSQSSSSGRPPFVSLPDGGTSQPGNQVCPNEPDVVCGRFQFAQPFPLTPVPGGTEDLPDVLVITGVFTGKLSE